MKLFQNYLIEIISFFKLFIFGKLNRHARVIDLIAADFDNDDRPHARQGKGLMRGTLAKRCC